MRSSSTTRRSTSSCSPPTRRPASSTPYTQLTGRAPRGAALEPRAVGVARVLQDAGGGDRRRGRSCASGAFPCDVLTLDGRAAWNAETRFDFEWDPDRFPIRARRSRRSTRTTCASACGSIRTCRSTRALFRELAQRGYLLKTRERRSVRVRLGHDARHEPVRRRADAAAAKAASSISPIPDAYAWWRDAHAALFADGVDVIKSDFGEQVPDDAVALQRRLGTPAAQRLSAAVQPLRVRGDRASSSARTTDRRWCGAAPAGPAASAIRSAGAAIRKATGKASPRRSAAGCRGA